MAVLVVVVFVVNLLLQRPPLDSALFSLALAVGLTPQLLPAIVAISLSVGARVMAAERVIVRRLDAIEDIGAMTILCSDKTGTMTEGRMQLIAYLSGQGAEDPEVRRLATLNAALQTAWRNPIDDALIASGVDLGGVVPRGTVPYDFLRAQRRWWAWIPAGVLAGGAIVVLFTAAEWVTALTYVWPVAVIIGGGVLIWNAVHTHRQRIHAGAPGASADESP